MGYCFDQSVPAAMNNAAYLPRDYPDSRIARGTLLLMEPGHPAQKQVGTVLPTIPFNQGYSHAVNQFPNLAADAAAELLDFTPFDATLSITAGRASVTATSGVILDGDEVWNASLTVLLGVIADIGATNGGTGFYAISPSQTLASTAVKIVPSSKPLIRRANDQMPASNVEQNFAYEWTPKGGLHIVSSRTTMTATVTAMGPALPGSIKRYLYANPGHEYFLSLWYKITAPLLAGNTAPYMTVMNGAANNSYLFRDFLTPLADTFTSGPEFLTGARNTVGDVHYVAGNTFRNMALASATGLAALPLHAGIAAGAWGPNVGQNKSMSFVFQSMMLEDRTVSGRTYAQLKAIDAAARARAFAVGGRYYGDTNTAPAVLMA